MNKKQQSILDAYNNSNLTNIYQCYDKPSYFKVRAFNECKDACDACDGWGFKILSYNTFMFTIAYQYKKDGKTWLHYESDKSVRDFIIDEGDAYDYDDFKKDYDALSENTKKHLANAGVSVSNMQQAKDLMQISALFDLLLR